MKTMYLKLVPIFLAFALFDTVFAKTDCEEVRDRYIRENDGNNQAANGISIAIKSLEDALRKRKKNEDDNLTVTREHLSKFKEFLTNKLVSHQKRMAALEGRAYQLNNARLVMMDLASKSVEIKSGLYAIATAYAELSDETRSFQAWREELKKSITTQSPQQQTKVLQDFDSIMINNGDDLISANLVFGSIRSIQSLQTTSISRQEIDTLIQSLSRILAKAETIKSVATKSGEKLQKIIANVSRVQEIL